MYAVSINPERRLPAMGEQHYRHLAPIRRRERKTVHADERWKPIVSIVTGGDVKRNVNIGKTVKKQEL